MFEAVLRRLARLAWDDQAALRATQQTWEQLARRDPFWAVLTDRRREHGGWSADEFFATGELEIARVLTYLASQGISPPDRTLALDFGCGLGRLTRALARRFDEAHGVDAAPTMVERARELNAAAPGRMRFLLNQAPDLRQLASPDYAFVYSSIVLQHLPPASALGYVSELLRLAKPRGLVVFQAVIRVRPPLRRRLRAKIRRWARRLELVPDDLRIEMHALDEAEVLRRASAAGFEALDVVFTNSGVADANGAIEFFREGRGGWLESRQFTLRRR